MKRDDFLHPLLARRWWVGMNVHSLWHFRVCLARHQPSTVIYCIISKSVWRFSVFRRVTKVFYFYKNLFKAKKFKDGHPSLYKAQLNLTCCEICTDNHPLLQCLVVKYISTYCLNLIHETSSVETFACEWR